MFKWDGMGRLFRRRAYRSCLFWPTSTLSVKCDILTEKTSLLYKPAKTQPELEKFWSVLIICGCYIACRLCFVIIPFKLFFIFSRLCITAFRLFFLIFNISDCYKDCYTVECARPPVQEWGLGSV